MTSNRDPLVPGHVLQAIARRLFSESVFTSVIEPAFADFEQEVLHARPNTRRAVRIRGTLSLCHLLLAAGFLPGAGAGSPLLSVVLGLNGGFLVGVLAPILFGGLWPTFGAFTGSAAAAGVLLAFGLAAWNQRHPTEVACTRPDARMNPEINLSRIPVGGNVGGFFFVLASSLTILVGLPELRGFVAAAALGGAAMAMGLFAWRRSHLESPVRRVLVR
jgi:hypothetical protein